MTRDRTAAARANDMLAEARRLEVMAQNGRQRQDAEDLHQRADNLRAAAQRLRAHMAQRQFPL